MAKKIKPVDGDAFDEAADKKALDEKVAEYMGPAPDEQAVIETPVTKIEVTADPESAASGGELLPTSEIPEEIIGEPEETSPADEPTEPISPEEQPQPETQDALNDPETDKAVDEITAAESDAVIEAEDQQKLDEAFSKKKPSFKDKLRGFWQSWWNNPKYRWSSIIGLLALLLVLLGVPTTRYFMLNTVGVRASASLTVVDDKTFQPLKNVTVSIGKTSGQTDPDGKLTLYGLKLGSSELIVNKRAFAKIDKKIVVGWGSNPIGNVSLNATGAQYFFKVSDFLSDKPITKIEADSGDASAVADEKGEIVLTVDYTEDGDLLVSLSGKYYRTENLTIKADNHEQQAVKMVPARQEVFISKRSGKYDLYKVDADGKNEQLLLAGTGAETDNLTLSVHPTDEVVAYVSTRDNARNHDGYLLRQLYLVDIKTGKATKLDSLEDIRALDWIGDRLIYVKIAEGASAANPKRYRLVSYDYKTGDSKELASGNSFNDVSVIGNAIYFAPAAAYQSTSNIGLFKINADGTTKQTILSQEVWNAMRTSYDKLSIQTASGDWYEYTLGGQAPSKMAGAPNSPRSRLFVNSNDNLHSLWIDVRDGKGVLINHDVNANSEATLQTQTGLKYPVRWLDNKHVVYRINSGQEIADYVVNIEGGSAKKVRDVTDTGGIEDWYYYY